MPPKPDNQVPHIPVLLDEVLEVFSNRPCPTFVDGTLGAAGHAAALLNAHSEMTLIGIDRDPVARELARERLAPFAPRFEIIAGDFSLLNAWAKPDVDGILLDLGVSSMQLDTPERGFTFSGDAPLDMRMDPNNPLTAQDLLNTASEEDLARILKEGGDIATCRRTAKAIVQARPIRSTQELYQAVKGIPGLTRSPKIHPLTRIFQALRIAVNDEFGALQRGLLGGMAHLNPGGRFAVISYHSGEDRIVKEVFRDACQTWRPDPTHPYGGTKVVSKWQLVTRKPIVPSKEEERRNPRSRSAKLRVIERLSL